MRWRTDPFVIDVTSPEVYAPGVEVFEVQDRVSAGQTAVHAHRLSGQRRQGGHRAGGGL